ncbi:MAG: hypothetical protein JO249_07875 [Acidobacteria bacterium]|nr:hypothetical protein [Acidobacteriota bacterium]
MRKRPAISPQAVADYWQLFVNRRAYTLQSKHPHTQTGRHYYFRPNDRRTGMPRELNEGTIRRHLRGEITIGLYAMNPENQCCKWAAIDADYKNAIHDLLKLRYRLSQDGVQAALEKSRRGGHLWIFLEKPLPAKHCRTYIHNLAFSAAVPLKESAGTEGIEIFPKHDRVELGRFGSAMRGPLGIHRAGGRRFWFYGADHTVAAQVAYLAGLRKLKQQELRTLIAGQPGTKTHNSRTGITMFASGFRTIQGKAVFRILEHIGPVRKVGRNYITRCPSCAKAGHDRSGDNLAILIADPRFYCCWAGCNKEAIRSALGYPIPRPEGRFPEIF